MCHKIASVEKMKDKWTVQKMTSYITDREK